MQQLTSLDELRAWRKQLTGTLALVPTMGNLHEGHLKLVDAAKQQAQQVVVSIFVNPMQFGANEDLASYPRTFEADCLALAERGAAAVFAPTISDVYPRVSTNKLSLKCQKSQISYAVRADLAIFVVLQLSSLSYSTWCNPMWQYLAKKTFNSCRLFV